MIISPENLNDECLLGIAATDAVDELTKKYPGRSEGYDHEGWLIAVGRRFKEVFDSYKEKEK